MFTHSVKEEIKFGMLIIPETKESSLPLKRTTVNGQIQGPICTMGVSQYFENPLNETAELEYLFPLPHKASIINFEIQIGKRQIKGDLQEIEQARDTYEQAREQGHLSGLLEKRRPNLFAVHIANVLPNVMIKTTINYQERLILVDEEYEFIFPMGVTPRYHSREHPDEAAGVDAPIADADDHMGIVEISLSVDAGSQTSEPTSVSHPIEVTRLDERRFNVQLASETIPNKDFILRYRLSGDEITISTWRAKGQDADYFLATITPPVMKDTVYSTPPREFIFVLDRSGSMRGEPIAQARNALSACLRTLNEDDNFRILLFDHELDWFKLEPCPVNQKAIDEADKFISGIEGRGGTEIVSAINSALSIPDDPTRSRYVIFLTDGAVSAEERALQEIRSHINVARIFTFGIGPSVNRALLQRLAVLGRGASEFIQLNEDIEGAIIRFQDRISFPVLTNVNIKWKNIKAWDIYPSLLPDLYIGEPLEISGRLSAGKKSPILIVEGELENRAMTFEVKLPAKAKSEPAISRLWAKSRIEDLIEKTARKREMQPKMRAEIISLALEHHLVTPYTAYVAIDKEITSQGGTPKKIYVSQPLPEGLDINGFTAGQGMFSMKAPRMMRKMAVPSPYRSRSGKSTSPTNHMASIVSDSMSSGYHAIPRMEALEEEAEMTYLEPSVNNIRWLARKQKLNGSWGNDVEKTSAAVLAFLRNGHTDRKGHYRKQISRAISWLNANSALGLASFVKALALTELSKMTGLKAHQEMALIAANQLPQPGTELERSFLEIIKGKERSSKTPRVIKNLDDLRSTVINRIILPVPGDLRKSSDEELIKAWIAAQK